MSDVFTFTLNRDNHYEDGVTKTVNMSFSSEAPTVNHLLEEFMSFMRACDYHFGEDSYLNVMSQDNMSFTQPVDSIVVTTAVEVHPQWKFSDTTEPVDENAADFVLPNMHNSSFTLPINNIDGLVTTSSIQIDGSKLTELENTILPFLENLKKDPEKTMLRWPNREQIINQQIQKIKSIMGIS